MIYLTFNDPPSGIYSGQVIDVCRFLNTDMNAGIRLVALVSSRGFMANRRKIKSQFPDAIVLPMFPGVGNWSVNILWLIFICLFLGRQSIIARGPFAATLALRLKKIKLARKVCFDARGAYTAEFNEYNVSGSAKLNAEIKAIERNTVLKADFRLAVSNQLVAYWAKTFGYNSMQHVIIPCTISSSSSIQQVNDTDIKSQRGALGFADNDVILVYSGSSAAWQSIKLADDFLLAQMQQNPNCKVLFLTDKLPDSMLTVKEFPGRVMQKWLVAEQVANVLRCCDYGLLIREKSITNLVSSPVKFAEYLAAGLQVVISSEIGDYPGFVIEHHCGVVLNAYTEKSMLGSISVETKNRNIALAEMYYTKKSRLDGYIRILSALK